MELASGGGRCDDFGCDGCFEVQFPELFKISDGKVKATRIIFTMVGQEDENMLCQNEEEEGEDKSPNVEEDVPDEDIVGVLVGPVQARNSVVRELF